MEEKRCSSCKVTKPLSEFYNSKTSKDGRHHSCRSCNKVLSGQHYHEHSDNERLCPVCGVLKPGKHFYRASASSPCYDCRVIDIPAEKECCGCHEVKSAGEFYRRVRSADGLHSRCKECAQKQYRQFYPKHKKAQQKKNRARIKAIKDAVIAGYGGKCACCGESERAFLTLDHVIGRVAQGHSKMHISNGTHYKDALRRNFPPDYQVLCYNCNCTKGFFGACPHTLQDRQAA